MSINKTFSGYIVLPKRKEDLSLKDLEVALTGGFIYKTRTKAEMNVFTYERVEKVDITIKVGGH